MPSYVMMPVPEDYVEEVMQYIIRALAKASIEPWDETSISEVFHEVDEVSRSLLAFTARATMEGRDLSDAEAAKSIQMTPRETAGIINELTSYSRDANRPTLVNSRAVTERLPNGRTQDKRVLQMDLDIAELVTAAEAADLQNTPDPLAGSGG